jgi:hypothetical protein
MDSDLDNDGNGVGILLAAVISLVIWGLLWGAVV